MADGNIDRRHSLFLELLSWVREKKKKKNGKLQKNHSLFVELTSCLKKGGGGRGAESVKNKKKKVLGFRFYAICNFIFVWVLACGLIF